MPNIEKNIETEMEIPGNIYVNCPLHGNNFPLINVKKYCVPCDYWKGFFKQDYKDIKVPFDKQYSVNCCHPVSRQLIKVIN